MKSENFRVGRPGLLFRLGVGLLAGAVPTPTLAADLDYLKSGDRP